MYILIEEQRGGALVCTTRFGGLILSLHKLWIMECFRLSIFDRGGGTDND